MKLVLKQEFALTEVHRLACVYNSFKFGSAMQNMAAGTSVDDVKAFERNAGNFVLKLLDMLNDATDGKAFRE